MAEIEEVLGLWLVRCGAHLREWKSSGTVPDASGAEAKRRYDKLRENHRLRHFSSHPQGRIAKVIVTLLIAGWVTLVALDAISLFF